jgi:hypothetical protein
LHEFVQPVSQNPFASRFHSVPMYFGRKYLMFPYDVIMIGRDVYQERLADAEMERRAASLRTTSPGVTGRIANRIGDLLINLGHQLKHQQDWQTDARSSRA